MIPVDNSSEHRFDFFGEDVAEDFVYDVRGSCGRLPAAWLLVGPTATGDFVVIVKIGSDAQLARVKQLAADYGGKKVEAAA
jgi:hypothetical protein